MKSYWWCVFYGFLVALCVSDVLRSAVAHEWLATVLWYVAALANAVSFVMRWYMAQRDRVLRDILDEEPEHWSRPDVPYNELP